MSKDLDALIKSDTMVALQLYKAKVTSATGEYEADLERKRRVWKLIEGLEKQPAMTLQYSDKRVAEPVMANGMVNGYLVAIAKLKSGAYGWYVKIPPKHPWFGEEEAEWHGQHPPYLELKERAQPVTWWVGEADYEYDFAEAFEALKLLVDRVIAAEG